VRTCRVFSEKRIAVYFIPGSFSRRRLREAANTTTRESRISTPYSWIPADNCGHDRQRRSNIGIWVTIIAHCLIDYNQVSTPHFLLFPFHQLSPSCIVFTQQPGANNWQEECSLSGIKFPTAHPKMKQDTKIFVSISDKHLSCRIE
jgi:hypothetical protein